MDFNFKLNSNETAKLYYTRQESKHLLETETATEIEYELQISHLPYKIIIKDNEE